MSSGKIVFDSWLIVMNMQFDFNTKIELTPLWYNSKIKVDKNMRFFVFVFTENGIEKE